MEYLMTRATSPRRKHRIHQHATGIECRGLATLGNWRQPRLSQIVDPGLATVFAKYVRHSRESPEKFNVLVHRYSAPPIVRRLHPRQRKSSDKSRYSKVVLSKSSVFTAYLSIHLRNDRRIFVIAHINPPFRPFTISTASPHRDDIL